MGSPYTAPHNHFSHPKPPTTFLHPHHHHPHSNNIPQFCYEPTSVLELRRSPSPAAVGVSDSITAFPSVVSDDTSLPWDEDDLHYHTMILGLEDDEDNDKDDVKNPPQFCPPPPPPPPPTFEPQISNHSNLDSFDPSPSPFLLNDFSNSNLNLEFDCTQLDQLIRAAASIESNDLHLAHVLLARLNQQLSSATGKPLQRSAFYFKEALLLLLSGSNGSSPQLSNHQIIHKIKAYKAFTDISPITMFANFTANQALLEALDGAMFIHVIDFDIEIGSHWASFMQEIATKAKSRNGHASAIRITAIVPEESAIEARLTRDNLQQFAQELGIQFQIEFVFFNSFESLLFNSVRFINGELIAVNLSPSIFYRLRTSETIAGFLRFLRRISPRITVFVDGEGCRDIRGSTFRRNFVNGLEFYSCLMESLDATNSGDGELIQKIERFILRPKIASNVSAAAANCILPWREMLSSVGMLPVQLSDFTDCQAEWLVRRTQMRGFHVVKRPGVILLCWHERELVATSAWRC